MVDAGGLRMHVAELGPEDAQPILFVHGWPQHWWCWRRVAREVASDHRCLMADLRGHGWTEAPHHGYQKEQLASDLLALLDALDLERVGYVGHDWGAFTGFLLGLRAPERLTGLLALSIPHLWPSRRDQRNPARLAAFAYQLPLSTPLVGEAMMRGGMTRRVLELASPVGTFSEEDLRAYDEVMRRKAGARVTVAMYRSFVLREVGPILAGRYADARLDLPARLVVGDRDPVVRNADLQGHEANAPQMIVERIRGAGHFVPEERPELVAQHVRALLGGG
jgi:pimeloyl-ACP methyl ester carboxylesterase